MYFKVLLKLESARSSIGRFYDCIQPLYPVVDLFLRKQRRLLIDKVNLQRAGRLLDVGVGTGSHLPLYRHHQVTAIDLSRQMVKKASSYSGATLQVMQMDGEQLSFPDSMFDYVVMCHVVAVASNPDRLIEEAYRVLKPGGRCYVLNHFTPRGGLGYIDRAVQPIASLLKFQSNFTMESMPSLKKFIVLDHESAAFGYYKQLTLVKE